MGVYLRAKLEVSSIILTGFRHGGNFTPPPPTSKRTPKKPTQVRVKYLNKALPSLSFSIFQKLNMKRNLTPPQTETFHSQR